MTVLKQDVRVSNGFIRFRMGSNGWL